jgi:hypothetical protein
MTDRRDTLTEGQRAYEAKRAAKAGMSLEKWLAQKAKQAGAAEREQASQVKDTRKAAKPPGLISRLLDRAHKPL